ncbi:MAG: polysaccharide lyase family 7 protein [Bacteroidales bacterium]
MRKQFLQYYFLLISLKSIALNPQLPPGSNFDLSAWEIQTLDSNLSLLDVYSNDLMNGYSSNFFFTNPTDGSLVFNVPSNGQPLTGPTGHPRVELRQMTNGANWLLTDSVEHYLTVECRVMAIDQVSSKSVIGQIHSNVSVNGENLKLTWKGYLPKQCSVIAVLQTNDAAKTNYSVTLASGLSLGDLVSCTITMKNGTITCTVNGVSTTETLTTAFYSNTDNYYFKAGNYFGYNNVNVGSSTVVNGVNQFYKISLNRDLTGLNEPKIDLLKAYPNPVKDKLRINYNLASTSKVSIDIFDVTGRLLKRNYNSETQLSGNQCISIDVTEMKNGIYFARINADKCSQTIRFMVLN